jgi:hypothetical protein
LNQAFRHLPHLPLPEYAYLPGITWRPKIFPAMELIKAESDTKKQAQQAYLYGWDLANHEFHWESHEAWELCWNLWGRNSERACVVQGLIFISAARLKFISNKFCSAEKLTKKAKNRLFSMQDHCKKLGFSPDSWLKNWDASQKWRPIHILPTCF